MAHGRRPPVFPSHIRDLRGRCWVVAGRNHADGTPIWRVGWTSGGGDIHFISKPILVEDHAWAAMRIVAEVFNATADEKSQEVFDIGAAIG